MQTTYTNASLYDDLMAISAPILFGRESQKQQKSIADNNHQREESATDQDVQSAKEMIAGILDEAKNALAEAQMSQDTDVIAKCQSFLKVAQSCAAELAAASQGKQRPSKQKLAIIREDAAEVRGKVSVVKIEEAAHAATTKGAAKKTEAPAPAAKPKKSQSRLPRAKLLDTKRIDLSTPYIRFTPISLHDDAPISLMDPSHELNNTLLNDPLMLDTSSSISLWNAQPLPTALSTDPVIPDDLLPRDNPIDNAPIAAPTVVAPAAVDITTALPTSNPFEHLSLHNEIKESSASFLDFGVSEPLSISSDHKFTSSVSADVVRIANPGLLDSVAPTLTL